MERSRSTRRATCTRAARWRSSAATPTSRRATPSRPTASPSTTPRTDTWGPANTAGGVSRNVRADDLARRHATCCCPAASSTTRRGTSSTTWPSSTRPPASSSRWAAALRIAGQNHVVGAQVVHAVRGDELWFAGYFDHAGVNANALNAAPVPSAYVAMYDPTRILDPNFYLEVAPLEPVDGPSGNSSVSVNVELAARLTQGEGTITWYERRSDGAFTRRAPARATAPACGWRRAAATCSTTSRSPVPTASRVARCRCGSRSADVRHRTPAIRAPSGALGRCSSVLRAALGATEGPRAHAVGGGLRDPMIARSSPSTRGQKGDPR